MKKILLKQDVSENEDYSLKVLAPICTHPIWGSCNLGAKINFVPQAGLLRGKCPGLVNSVARFNLLESETP